MKQSGHMVYQFRYHLQDICSMLLKYISYYPIISHTNIDSQKINSNTYIKPNMVTTNNHLFFQPLSTNTCNCIERVQLGTHSFLHHIN